MAVFGGLHVEAFGDGGGVVDGGVCWDSDCAGVGELGDHGVHDVVYGSGLVAGGAVEEAF